MLVESELEFDYNTKFISESDFKWIWIGLPESVYIPTPRDWLVISYLLQRSISHSLTFYQTFFLGGGVSSLKPHRHPICILLIESKVTIKVHGHLVQYHLTLKTQLWCREQSDQQISAKC